MKFFLLNFISFLIAVSSLYTCFHFEINFNDDGTDALSSLPLLKLDPMKSPNGKTSHSPEILNFFIGERAIFADLSELPTVSFLHYLPIHSLSRLKDFFLLI